MAELARRGQLPPKQLRPSRLKYEIHPGSTDDEGSTTESLVQATDSQIVIPETQLDEGAYVQPHENESDYGEPLSPNSAAILERTAAKKGTESSAADPFTVKFLTKDGFSSESKSASTPTFSFSQARKTAKTPPKVEATTSHPPALTSPTDKEHGYSADRAGNDDALTVPTPLELPSSVVLHAHKINHHAHSFHAEEAQPTPILEDNVLGKGKDDDSSRASLFNANNDMPPSAQPGRSVVSGTKKKRNVKKGKKSRKALPTFQQQVVPWPPRDNGVMSRQDHEASSAHEAQVEESNIPIASPPAEPSSEYQGAQDDPLFQQGWEDHTASHDNRDNLYQDVTHSHQNLNEHDQNLELLADEHQQYPANIIGSNVLEAAPSQAIQTGRSSFPPVHPDQAAHRSHSEADGYSNEYHAELPHASPIDEPVEHQQAVSQPVRHDTFPATHTGLEQFVSASHQGSAPQLGDDDAHVQSHHLNEGVLRDVSERNGAPRVTKTKRKRAICSQALPPSTAARVRGLPALSGFEQSLESVRLAFLAEQYRKSHDHATEVKHLEEVKTLLQDQINLQNVTIMEWKDKHDKLSDNVTMVREKAKTNQKYVAGLQNDYQKLQKSTAIFQDDCKKALQQKVAEVESEKESLWHEFEKTLTALAKGQKNLRETIDDLYVRLVISESKRKDLAENLNKEVAMYEEEKRKRNELEKQLLCSVQRVQRQLGDGSTSVTERLGNLQTSLAHVAAVQEQDSGVQDCLAALQKLQATPFLTSKDAQKSEGMLRFVHERFDSKLNSLTHTIAGKADPTENIQAFIENRLQKLQMEMLKYEEVVTESRRVQQTNELLMQEMEAKNEHAERLNEQIKAHRQTEEALKARTLQIEGELESLKEVPQDHDAYPLVLERELTDLRQQLKKAEDDRKQWEGLRQNTEQELANLKVFFKESEKGALELQNQHNELKQKHSQCEQIPDLRRKILEELQQTFVDKENGLKNDIHRLTVEHDEKAATIQQARERHDEDRRTIEAAKIELNAVRKEKKEAEAKMETAQREIQGNSSRHVEITKLKEQLRQKIEELSIKSQEFAELEREHAQLRNSCEQQQAEIAEHPSAIESMRQEMETERSEMNDKASTALQAVQNRVIDISKEKDSLQLKLEKTQVNETKLVNAIASLSAEKITLRTQINELRTANDEKEAQSLRAQPETAEEIRQHSEHSDDLQRQLEQSQAALKEAAAKNRLQEAQHVQKLEFDRKKYESLLLDMGRDLDKARAGNDSITQKQSQAAKENPSRSLQNMPVGKTRKKVDPQDHSVLDVIGSSCTQIVLSQGHDFDLEHDQTLFDEETQNVRCLGKPSGDQECSVVDPAPAFAEDTQEMSQLRLSSEDFEAEIGQNPFELPKHQFHSSTDNSSLSVLGSDEILLLQSDDQRASKPMLRGQDQRASKQLSSQMRIPETPPRKENVFGIASQLSRSYDRPASQANTASRLMPPPGHVSHQTTQRKQVEGPNGKGVDRHVGSSPDYMQQASSTSKHTYTRHNAAVNSRNEHVRGATPTPAPSRNSKRKSPDPQETSLKRQRTSSQAFPSCPPSEFRNQSPHPSQSSGAGSRYKIQNMTTLPTAPSSKPSRSRTQAGSSSVDPHDSSQLPSSGDGYQSRSHQLSSSHASAAAPAHRTSTRQTRSKTQSQKDRFNQELQRR